MTRIPSLERSHRYGVAPGYYGYAASPVTDRNYGVQTNRKVDVYLEFANSSQNHLGMPLPSGRMRVSKLDDADRTLEFIGENVIDHTPANEKVLIKLSKKSLVAQQCKKGVLP